VTALVAVGAIAGGGYAASALGTGDTTTAGGGGGPKAKNVILFIGDGMGVSHITAARQRYHGADGALSMERLPVLGTVSTYAVERKEDADDPTVPELVTDSASAGTAWASGVKTYNAAIGKDAAGRTVPTLMEQAKERGMRTGNVSTAEITDATPAVQFSHAALRGCQGPDFSASACEEGDVPIAEQIARNGVADVILGGGLSRFEPDDQDAMEADGYTVLGSFGDPALAAQTADSQTVPTKDDLAGVTGGDRRVIGLFNRGNLTVERFKRENPDAVQAGEPTLPEMTTKAIALLADSEDARRDGFFLQVEGALIDKRSHANDAAQTLEEMKAFDDAIAEAVEWAEADGDTLVIVTADHECAGFNIIGKGSFTNAEAAAPPVNVDAGNTANDSVPSRPSTGALDPARSTGPVNGAGSGDAASFAPATFRTADDPEGVEDGDPAASLWLTYLSGNHTGANVNLYASGPGSAAFEGSLDNTDIYGRMRDALRAFDAK